MSKTRLLLLLLLWAQCTRPGRLPPAPLSSRTIEGADGTPLHVEVGGQQDADITVVLAHGLLARSIEFDQQWAALQSRVRLVRFDHRNHGRSGHSDRAVHLDDLASDLRAVITTVIPDGQVVIVGHSMGGIATIALAEMHPELFGDRVTGVALISAAAGHDLPHHQGENRVRQVARRHGFAAGLVALRLISPALEQIRPRRTLLLRRITRQLLFGSTDADPALLSMTQALLEEPPLATLTSLQGALLRADVRGGLATLRTIPTLVLTGTDDRLVRPDHSRLIAADLGSQAQLIEVAGAGHVVNQSCAPAVNAALHTLLDRVSTFPARSASSQA